jgi:hypothetical protein
MKETPCRTGLAIASSYFCILFHFKMLLSCYYCILLAYFSIHNQFLISMIIQSTSSNLSPGRAALSQRQPASAGKFCGSCAAQGHTEVDICTIRLNDTYKVGCRCLKGRHSFFIFGRSQLQISIRSPSSFCGFSRSVHSGLGNS